MQSGTRLGSYEILEPLGAGGMGEVYRARDATLDRDVAIKILPEDIAGDAERLQRFEREAKLLASLNHANLATVHGFEESDGVHFLTMECVEGETLAERLASSGRLGYRDALDIARQTAAGLEAAHAAGIVHRDLKPANVKVTPDGQVKVLDFGLAKLVADEPSGPSSPPSETASPTIAQLTATGTTVGTTPYMSPEQARGERVDGRTDTWAFGCVLYELLAGKRCFDGRTHSDVVAAILEREPDFDALPHDIPGEIRRMLERCLRKSLSGRLHAIADARIEIEDCLAGPSSGAEVRGRAGNRQSPAGRLLWATAGLVAGILLTVAISSGGGPGSGLPVTSSTRFTIPLPAGMRLPAGDYPELGLALSPNGRHIAFVGGEDWYDTRLYVRALDSLDVRAIPGSESARQPFFSPDSTRLAFFNRSGELKTATIEGGDPVTVARDIPGSSWSFGSWGDDGFIVFSTFGTAALHRVAASGGDVELLPVTRADWALTIVVLPGSRDLLYTAVGPAGSSIVVHRVATGQERVVLENAANPAYLGDERLLFSRDGVPLVVGFDPAEATVRGEPASLGEATRVDSLVLPSAIPILAASTTGTIVFAGAADIWGGSLVWVDRTGAILESVSEPGSIPVDAFFHLSPGTDGIALSFKRDRMVRLDTLEIERGVTTQQLNLPSLLPVMPAWLDAPGSVAFSSSNVADGTIYRHEVGAAADPVAMVGADSLFGVVPWEVSPDGEYLAYGYWDAEQGANVIRFHPLRGALNAPEFLVTEDFIVQATFSPDGTAIAYVSDESGGMEVYVRDFPGGGNKRRVSTGGGWAPQWAPDGDELFYQSRDGSRTYSVTAEGRPRRFGPPVLLFEGPFRRSTDVGLRYDVAHDGDRFLMMRQDSDVLEVVPELIVVLNAGLGAAEAGSGTGANR